MSSTVLIVLMVLSFWKETQSISSLPWECSGQWTSCKIQGQRCSCRTDNWFDLIHCERQIWPTALRQLNMTSPDMWVQWIDILLSAYLSTEENSADCIQSSNDLKAVRAKLGILVLPWVTFFSLTPRKLIKFGSIIDGTCQGVTNFSYFYYIQLLLVT